MRLAGHFQNKPKCKNVQTIGMTLVIYIITYRVVEITFSSCYFIICDYSAYTNETAVYLKAFVFISIYDKIISNYFLLWMLVLEKHSPPNWFTFWKLSLQPDVCKVSQPAVSLARWK